MLPGGQVTSQSQYRGQITTAMCGLENAECRTTVEGLYDTNVQDLTPAQLRIYDTYVMVGTESATSACLRYAFQLNPGEDSNPAYTAADQCTAQAVDGLDIALLRQAQSESLKIIPFFEGFTYPAWFGKARELALEGTTLRDLANQDLLDYNVQRSTLNGIDALVDPLTEAFQNRQYRRPTGDVIIGLHESAMSQVPDNLQDNPDVQEAIGDALVGQIDQIQRDENLDAQGLLNRLFTTYISNVTVAGSDTDGDTVISADEISIITVELARYPVVAGPTGGGMPGVVNFDDDESWLWRLVASGSGGFGSLGWSGELSFDGGVAYVIKDWAINLLRMKIEAAGSQDYRVTSEDIALLQLVNGISDSANITDLALGANYFLTENEVFKKRGFVGVNGGLVSLFGRSFAGADVSMRYPVTDNVTLTAEAVGGQSVSIGLIPTTDPATGEVTTTTDAVTGENGGGAVVGASADLLDGDLTIGGSVGGYGLADATGVVRVKLEIEGTVHENVVIGLNLLTAYAWRAVQPYEAYRIDMEAYANFPISISDRFKLIPGVSMLYYGNHGDACFTESDTGNTFCDDRGYDSPVGRLQLGFETPFGDDGSKLTGELALDLMGRDGASMTGEEYGFDWAVSTTLGVTFPGIGQ